jgi:hypothetical protein
MELLMARDARKQQQKQERRAAKRKAKSRELARVNSAGLAERLAAADKYPVIDCWMAADVWTQGIGYVALSRELPGGNVGFSWFLVDRFCLGVKDVIVEIAGRSRYDEQRRKVQSRFRTEPMDPAAARKFVEGAVTYAEKLGLPPHADYQKAKHIFGSIDASACTETFEYGKDGKPYFFAGPYDTPERCRRILAALERHCGPGGYHFTMPATGLDVLPTGARERDVHLIDMAEPDLDEEDTEESGAEE